MKISKWKLRNSERVVNWRRRTKEKLVKYKGGKCELCPFNKPYYSCYDFHHRDPSKKDFGIGAKGTTRSLESLFKEADKCMLLCKNCHAELHDKEYAESRKASTERHETWLRLRLQDKTCPTCRHTFKPDSNRRVYCSIKCCSKRDRNK